MSGTFLWVIESWSSTDLLCCFSCGYVLDDQMPGCEMFFSVVLYCLDCMRMLASEQARFSSNCLSTRGRYLCFITILISNNVFLYIPVRIAQVLFKKIWK